MRWLLSLTAFQQAAVCRMNQSVQRSVMHHTQQQLMIAALQLLACLMPSPAVQSVQRQTCQVLLEQQQLLQIVRATCLQHVSSTACSLPMLQVSLHCQIKTPRH